MGESVIGTPHHLALQRHGLSSGQATALMGIPSIDAGKILQWVEKKGPVALRMLKVMLPALINDPELVSFLTSIIDAALAS